MECLHGPKAQVVLDIKEGNGFAFLTHGLVAVASFTGNSLETEVVPPSSRPKFESLLVWEVETKYLRKLRSSNTALKVEFYSVDKKGSETLKRDRIGYVLLNLKEADIGFSSDKEIGSWHKLLFLKSIFNAHKPEVFILFKIQDLLDMDTANVKISKPTVSPERMQVIPPAGSADWSTVDQLELKPIQIGPPPLCTELYQFTISFLAFDHLLQIIPPEKLGQPFKIQFTIFGDSITTEELSSTLENGVIGERITFNVWSRTEFLSAYFREFPSLILSLFCEDIPIGTADLNLQVLSNMTKKNVALNSILTVKSASHIEDFRYFDSDPLPSLQVSVDIMCKNDSIMAKVDQEIQTYQILPEKKVDAVTSTEGMEAVEPATIPHYDSLKGENQFPSREINLTSEDLETENTSVRNHKGAINSSKSIKEPLKERKNFSLRTPPPTFRFSTYSVNHPMDVSKEYVRDAALRACEELEDWKEKQQQIFEFEIKKKTERRLKKLSSEWLKRKQGLENDLKRKIEECLSLKDKLTEALEDLTNRTDIVAQREQELETAKEELNKKYTMKFQELRKASRLCEYDMEDRINIVRSENLDLKKKLDESGKEILRLQQALITQESPLSEEETKKLINQVKVQEQKLEKALESKTFFKEQWGKAVRELHRMKEEEQQQLKMQIHKNRKELQTLGLVREISEEVGEMKKDQFVIKNIRDELSNFFPSNDPITDVTCFSGT